MRVVEKKRESENVWRTFLGRVKEFLYLVEQIRAQSSVMNLKRDHPSCCLLHNISQELTADWPLA